MHFLQHPSRSYDHYGHDQMKAVESDKNKQNSRKSQEDISTFFQKNSVPLQDTNANIQRPTPTWNRLDMFGSQPEVEYRVPDQPEYANRSHDFGQFDSNSRSECLTAAQSCKVAPEVSPQLAVSIKESLEQRASQKSWSESQYSTGKVATVRNPVEDTSGTPSLTPESIRRVIRETGIFRNTNLLSPKPPDFSQTEARMETKNARFCGLQNDIERSGSSKIAHSNPDSSTRNNNEIRHNRNEKRMRKIELLTGRSPLEFAREMLAQDLVGHGSQEPQPTQRALAIESQRESYRQDPNSVFISELCEHFPMLSERQRLAETARIKRPPAMAPIPDCQQLQPPRPITSEPDQMIQIPEIPSMQSQKSTTHTNISSLQPPADMMLGQPTDAKLDKVCETAARMARSEVNTCEEHSFTQVLRDTENVNKALTQLQNTAQPGVNYAQIAYSRNPRSLGLPVRGGLSTRHEHREHVREHVSNVQRQAYSEVGLADSSIGNYFEGDHGIVEYRGMHNEINMPANDCTDHEYSQDLDQHVPVENEHMNGIDYEEMCREESYKYSNEDISPQLDCHQYSGHEHDLTMSTEAYGCDVALEAQDHDESTQHLEYTNRPAQEEVILDVHGLWKPYWQY